ncbi:hypothetical protein NZL82_07775 [Sphingomonas sanguinis]|uniref:hypothetical protein n=1 Tax=Sphingomonas sp. LC-1 TaxID=3110957 RepID=UPI0021BAF212|nr:hypothetical protein [Sphingomonas sp. LC-1]MCT8001778.1 hypothetical protein [Sphingomonas sp. LC-1]
MRRLYEYLIVIGAIFGASVSVWGAASQKKDRGALPASNSSDEVIVQALKIPHVKLPINVHWAARSELGSRIAYERADQFLRCAMDIGDPKWLRRAVEGPPNFSSTRYAQFMIAVANAGCYPPRLLDADPNTGDYANSAIDRGVLIERTLRAYAPDAALDRSQTFDPEVRARFIKTEAAHNRYRLGPSLAAFSLSACLVQTQPELATRLFRAEQGGDLVRGLEQIMIVNAPECLKGLKRVTIEPTTMRIHLIEAFYRWILAARNLPSLIPQQST